MLKVLLTMPFQNILPCSQECSSSNAECILRTLLKHPVQGLLFSDTWSSSAESHLVSEVNVPGNGWAVWAVSSAIRPYHRLWRATKSLGNSLWCLRLICDLFAQAWTQCNPFLEVDVIFGGIKCLVETLSSFTDSFHLCRDFRMPTVVGFHMAF